MWQINVCCIFRYLLGRWHKRSFPPVNTRFIKVFIGYTFYEIVSPHKFSFVYLGKQSEAQSHCPLISWQLRWTVYLLTLTWSCHRRWEGWRWGRWTPGWSQLGSTPWEGERERETSMWDSVCWSQLLWRQTYCVLNNFFLLALQWLTATTRSVCFPTRARHVTVMKSWD